MLGGRRATQANEDATRQEWRGGKASRALAPAIGGLLVVAMSVSLNVASSSSAQTPQTPAQPTLSVPEAAPGGQVTVTGTGFPAGSGFITFDYGSSPSFRVGDFVVNSDGGISILIAVPGSALGGKHVVAAEMNNGDGATFVTSTSLIVRGTPAPTPSDTAKPHLSLDPDHGAPGEQVTVTGTGFPAGAGIITFDYQGSVPSQAGKFGVKAPGGSFAVPIGVPIVASGGDHRVAAIINRDGVPTLVAEHGFTVQRLTAPPPIHPAKPQLLLRPKHAAPGSKVTVTGIGFPAGAGFISFDFGSSVPTHVGKFLVTRRGGSFTVPIGVPLSSLGGDHIVAAVMKNINGPVLAAKTTLTVRAITSPARPTASLWPIVLAGVLLAASLLSFFLLRPLPARTARATPGVPERIRAEVREGFEPKVRVVADDSQAFPTIRLRARAHLNAAEYTLEESIK